MRDSRRTSNRRYNGEGCVDCIFPLSLFDLESSKCVSPPPNGTNPKAESRLTGGTLKKEYYVLYCDEKVPFYNNKSCIDCVHPQSIFNLSSLNCVPAKPSASNPKANKRIANPQTIGSTVDTVCPDETPFFDGRICINCEKPAFFFNETSL